MNDFVNIELPFGGTFSYTGQNLQNKNDIIQLSLNRFIVFSSQSNTDYGILSIIDFEDYTSSNTYQVTRSEFFTRTFTPNFNGTAVRLEKLSNDRVLLVFGRDLYVIQINANDYTILLTETDFFVNGGIGLANTSMFSYGQRYNTYSFLIKSLFENEFFFIDNESATISFGSNTNQVFRFYHCSYDSVTNTITKTLKNTFSSSSENIGTSNNIQGEFRSNIHIIPGTNQVYMNFATSINTLSTNNTSNGGCYTLVRYSARLNSEGTVLETYPIPGTLTTNATNITLTTNAVNSVALRPNLIIYHRNAGTAVEVLYNEEFTSTLNIGTGADTNAVVFDLIPLDISHYIMTSNDASSFTTFQLRTNILKIVATDLITASQGTFSISESTTTSDRANTFKGSFILGSGGVYSIRLGNQRVDSGRINFPLKKIIV